MKKLDKNQMKAVDGGFGYEWKCQTTGWESGWHLTRSGAAEMAYDHTQKYPGHKVVVYGV